MAQHIAAGGHTLHLWARRAATLDPFRDGDAGKHARLHDSPAAVAAQVDVVVTMVADAPDVEEVLFGSDGVVSGARTALTVIDMSTIGPAAARDIGARLAAVGIDFLDAPVSGGEVGAINASLTIMAGGNAKVFERVKPLLQLMGKSLSLVGECGAGQVAKACNQILTGVGVVAVAEAMAFAKRSGVDPAKVREAMLGGFAYSRILENHGQRMIDGNFNPGFKGWMHQKDLHIVMAEAQRLGLTLPSSAATEKTFDALVAAGLGEEDSIAVLKLLESDRQV
jgi:3-hydroxyisobutyrate dehydrogenase-like beta-hydroxyacid dehydrogenase